uniref:6-phosphofructo-2-kinase domain-containing protein n=1 Tax=Entomoneis paludosa TaxID=265537 RepID=A0A7S3DVU0_9STRA|mmetsp:Transcript_5274/g.11150  ORF Transcript_5274/g.11150 Transcript_5274/m.11150 type:complete len:574 (+) Transcript_5274:279-2000(+)
MTDSAPASNGSTAPHVIDNPMPHRLPEGENATPLEVIGQTSSSSDKLVIVMVGLPATGKTHIAKRICRFLSFFHDIPSQIFNVGDYRRQLCGAQQPANFYDPTNAEGLAARTMACDAALADLQDYLRQPGARVAAFDATNSTRARRQHICQTLQNLDLNCKQMFVESICDEQELLEENIRTVKLSTPDYREMDPETAVKDFKRRRENYQKVYEPVEASEGPSIKIINSKQFVVTNIRGYLPLKVVHFCMNLHTLPRTFYLTRHGQSHYNLLGKIGGDSGLTPNGVEYAKRLAQFATEFISKETLSVEEQEKNDDPKPAPKPRPARLWTSTMRRTKETAQFIPNNTIQHTWGEGEDSSDKEDWVQFRPMARRNLDELYAGTCDGMTYKEIEQVFPEEFKRRQQDKLSYRYPRGESYMDVTLRLEPLALDMERTREPVLIIGHQGILRILYAYFMGLDRKDAPYMSIPLNNVIELTPHAYGCHERRYCLMLKEEMLQDGQDEPVTSMPMAADHSSNTMETSVPIEAVPPPRKVHQRENSRPSLVLDNQADFSQDIEVEKAAQYDSNDPVMNAPSC